MYFFENVNLTSNLQKLIVSSGVRTKIKEIGLSSQLRSSSHSEILFKELKTNDMLGIRFTDGEVKTKVL